MRKTKVIINKSNLIHNLNFIRSKVEGRKIIGVVKANAYGHGAVEVSKVLIENGVSALAVAYSEEGVILRKAGINVPIIVLVQQPVEDIDDIIAYDLEPAVGSIGFCEVLSDKALKNNKHINVHLFLDTGMNRDGISPHQVLEFMQKTKDLRGIRFEGILTHFSSSVIDGDYSHFQLDSFSSTLRLLLDNGFSFDLIHIASSATMINYREAYYDAVRVGIALYGYAPDERIKYKYDLKPVLSLKSNVVLVRRIKKGDSVSYNRLWVADKDTNIATIPIGYGDGYFKTLSGKTECIINNKKYPIVGAICMDELMVNVGDDEVQVGDECILIGKSESHEITAFDLANKIGTIPYEVTTLIAPRVPRIYID